MTTLKKYDFSGNEIGEVVVEDSLLDVQADPQMIKEYLVAIRKNARQWSAKTKGRSEINVTGKKPRQQKGSGHARQGSFAAPQFRGGGIVFGPRPKFDQHVRINKKERRAVIRFLIAEKIKNQHLILVKEEKWEEPKTKKAAEFFAKLDKESHRVMVLANLSKKSEHLNLQLSMRNLPRKTFAYLPAVNGYQLALFEDIVVMESMLDEVLAILGKESE
jgi:large subunit ribosomal protein L4